MGVSFNILISTREGDPISPRVFVIHLERATDKPKTNKEKRDVSVHGTRCLRILSKKTRNIHVERCVNQLCEEEKWFRLLLNVDKTKSIVGQATRKQQIERNISLEGTEIENVTRFTQLEVSWHMTTIARIKVVLAILTALKKLWKSNSITPNYRHCFYWKQTFSSNMDINVGYHR